MKNKVIALVGQPNAGKSTLFNVLSDIKTSTSNFAGTTVKVSECEINHQGMTYKLVDLPGVYSLNPADLAEEVTLDYLMNHDVDVIINVVNSTLLTRSLELTVELSEIGIPMVIALNMQDEAEALGIKINEIKLQEELNIPVVKTTSLYGKGVKVLLDKTVSYFQKKQYEPKSLSYTHHFEIQINELAKKIRPVLDSDKLSPRFLALKTLEIPEKIDAKINEAAKDYKAHIESDIRLLHRMDVFEAISYERHHLAMKLSEKISVFSPRKQRPFLDKLDDYLLSPRIGYLFLGIFFIAYYLVIFYVGDFISGLMESPLNFVSNLYAPLKATSPFLWYTIDGAFQGVSGAFGIVMPYFLPLVFLTSIFEDTGYLSRVAFLIDGVMHKIGLHGKSVAAFILGFGCTVPAVYATRILESRRDRIITGILIPFIPCSARISVIFALTAAFAGPIWAIIVFFYVLLVIAINGKLLSKFLDKPMGLILEIPSLKLPSLGTTLRKTYFKIKEFIRHAFLFLFIGSIVLGWIDYFELAKYVNIVFSPILKYVLGLPVDLGSTLVFGFLRKELIVIMAGQALGVSTLAQLPLTLAQVVTFIIFVTLYFPCFTTMVVTWKEFGWKVALISGSLSIAVATGSTFIFKSLFALAKVI